MDRYSPPRARSHPHTVGEGGGQKADTCKTHAQTKLFFIDSLEDLLLSEAP